jgi:hypothetical protein
MIAALTKVRRTMRRTTSTKIGAPGPDFDGDIGRIAV